MRKFALGLVVLSLIAIPAIGGPGKYNTLSASATRPRISPVCRQLTLMDLTAA